MNSNWRTFGIPRSLDGIGRLWCALLVTLALTGGCGEQPRIVSYEAPKPPKAKAVGESPASRLLGAVIPGDGMVWFLKSSGPTEAISQIADVFRAVAASFTLDTAGNPSWTLPEGWEELPGDGFRYRTLRTSVNGTAVEITISSLPAPPTDLNAYLLANFNRWRGQVGLGPWTPDEMASQREKLTVDGRTVYLCDFTGGGGMPNDAVHAGLNRAKADTTDTRSDGGTADLVGFVPEGWTPGNSSPPRRAAYEVKTDQGQAEVTVIPLPLAGGDPLANLNRWRGQVQLDPLSASEMEQQKTTWRIAGSDASYFAIDGTAQDGGPESILGVIAPRDTSVWFIKMRGPTPLIESQKANFEAFAKALRLP